MAAPTFELSTFSSEPTLTSRNRLENGINSALAALWSDVVENGGKIFASRQTAVDEGQAALPALFGRIVTMEGGLLVVRGPGQTEDQLFASYPNWGVVQKYEPGLWSEAVNALTSDVGKIFASRQAAVDAGQAAILPAYGRIITLEGSVLVIRGPGQTEDQLFTTYPNWGVGFRVDLPTEVSTRQDFMRFGSVIPATVTGGDGDDYNVELPAWFDVGAFWLVGMRFSFTPNLANVDTSPRVVLPGGSARTLQDVDGTAFPVGYLDPGRNFTFEVNGPNTARLVVYPVAAKERVADLAEKVEAIDSTLNYQSGLIDKNIAVVAQTSAALPPRPPRPVVYWQTWSDPSAVMQDPDIWLALPTPSAPGAPPSDMWDIVRGHEANTIVLRINYLPNLIPPLTNIQYRVDGGTWFNAASGQAVRGYTVIPLISAGSHNVEIRMRNYIGYGPVSEIKTVTASDSTTTTYTDSFDRADGVYLSTIAIWDTSNNGEGLIHSNNGIQSETSGGGSNPYGGTMSFAKGQAVHRGHYADNQFAQCEFQGLGNNQSFGPGILLQADTQLIAGSQGYLVVCKAGRTVIYKNIDGAWQSMENVTYTALAAPQKIRATYQDGVITVEDYNAAPTALLARWRDTSGTPLPTLGRPGIQSTWTSGEGETTGRILSFIAGNA